MKRTRNQPGLQMKLGLLHPPATTVPGGKQEELTQALMELLINAAQKNVEHAKSECGGGSSESETHA
jgi:hypothetical protein